ncbi:MAG: hypothetical protein DRI69_00600 [Bacteroidetes bacterium]|nr:MAG: hypothetical protein DRI69_00600 [Bacteroidota bacterium]
MDMLTHQAIVRAFVICFLLGVGQQSFAQCDFVFDQDIPDDSSISLFLEVDDLLIDDLSAGQALCGVKVTFKHDYVGDLTIELTSPSGQTVRLVGPVTDQINPTNLTTWDIGFVQCSSPVAPDAGFADTWDNEQAWAVFASYTGTYYPSSGCLQDFNIGSANGKWELTLTDADQNATGILLSAELIFCDNTGLKCSICDADAGVFDLTDVQICDGGSMHDSVFIPNYTQDIPDPALYNYVYLLSSDNVSYTAQSNLTGTGWPEGTYTICGLSYARVDSSELFQQLDTMTFGEVQLAFNTDAIDYCAEFSIPCISIIVHPIPDTTQLVESICNGTIYQVGGEIFSQPGEYFIDLVSSGGCDSVVHLDLSVVQVSASITQLDTLSCSDQTTILSAGGSNVPGTPKYNWSTSSGIIIGATNQASLVIGSSGVYTVTVTDIQSGCTDIVSRAAITDGSEPFVLVPDGAITCSDTVFTFETIVFPVDVLFEWAGPGGFTDSVQNPSVTDAGMYFLTVTDASGCQTVAQAEVSWDTMLVINTRVRVIKNCETQRTVIVADPASQQAYLWNGPAGFTSPNRAIVTPTAGTYVVGITQTNGCIAIDSITVSHDYTIPDIEIVPAKDSIDCGETVILTATSSSIPTVFNWSGAGGSIPDTNMMSATGPGEYIVEGIAPNLCKAIDTLTLYPGDGLSNVLTFTDTITCDKDTVSIGVISLGQVISYRWTGPGLVDSTTSFIRVVREGIYEVEMTDIAGCVQRASVEVARNTVTIWFWFISDTITCDNPVASLTFRPNRTVKYFEWLLPNSQVVTDSILSVTTGDRYFLTVVGENGCARVRWVEVSVDTIKPLIFIEPASYGCYDSIQLATFLPDSIRSLQWTGPGGFASNDPDPYIYQEGTYSLVATGPNGCTSTKDIMVDPDVDPPVIVTTSELLDCIDSMAVLTVASPDTVVTFKWFAMNIEVSDSASLTVESPGQYMVEATAQNNCKSFDTLAVTSPVTPTVSAMEDTINCRDASVVLTAISDSSNVNFSWLDTQGDSIGVGPSISVSAPGLYGLKGAWTNGCAFDTTVFVHIDTMRPIAVAMTGEVVKCLIQDIYLTADASIGDSLLYSWSTPNGRILIGATSDSVFVHGQGQYVLSVEEVVNHCTSTDTIMITEQPSTLASLVLTIIPECLGDLGGAIIFDDVIDAETGLIYSIGLNGGSTNPVFDSLPKGEYLVSAIDSFGCSVDSLIVLSETSDETVDLGPDLDILLGDPAPLMATLNVDSSILTSIAWTPQMPCDSCLSNTIYPKETQRFTIEVRDAGGCLASDEITVFVRERGQVYVPNIFSPNSDGVNDFLTLNAHPGVEFVNFFRIIDRWGNQVFGVENVNPHDEQIAWDGKFNGNELNPTVYAYVLELVLITGRVEVHSGDITLLR